MENLYHDIAPFSSIVPDGTVFSIDTRFCGLAETDEGRTLIKGSACGRCYDNFVVSAGDRAHYAKLCATRAFVITPRRRGALCRAVAWNYLSVRRYNRRWPRGDIDR
jgi:hypothetical protein